MRRAMHGWVLAVLAVWTAGTAHADYILTTPAPRLLSGEEIELGLLVTNPGDAPLRVDVPSPLHLRMDTGAAVALLEFQPDAPGPLEVAPGGFRRMTLRGRLPVEAAGPVTLTTAGFEGNALMVLAEQAPDAGVPAPVLEQAAPSERPEVQNAAAAATVAASGELVDKPPPLGVSVYEPVYFIVGGDGGLNAKFQISLRYRMFDASGSIARRLPWLDDLYFSYSQTSLWDLGDLSKPFRDSSYRPRFFYAHPDVVRMADGRLRLGLEGGFGHESNGKDGEESRSINIVFARPTLIFGDPEGQRLYVAPMVYHYLDREENLDIANYRGNVDLTVGFGRKSGWDVWGTMRKGRRGDSGSLELNVSYPLAKLSDGDLTGWLLLQYFAGYGESLIDYNRKLDAQLRFGIAVAL